jgi:hypothetical protein
VTVPSQPHEPPEDVATLRVSRAAQLDPGAVIRVLQDPSWLGDQVVDSARPQGVRTVLTDLVLPLPPDGRLLSFRKAAYVDLGPVISETAPVSIEIAWRSASLAPLFPVFAGRLLVRPNGLIDRIIEQARIATQPAG